MNKYLFLLVVPLLLFSIGCEKDDPDTINNDDTTGDITESLSFDSELFGVWSENLPDIDPEFGFIYSWNRDFISFGSNGKYVRWNQVNNFGDFYNSNESEGSWWTQDGFVFLDVSIYTYMISDNQLNLTNEYGGNIIYTSYVE